MFILCSLDSQGPNGFSPGSFGSPPTDRLDCGEPMLGEALDHFVSEVAYQGQRGIARRGEHFRCMARAGARLNFTAPDIAYVMKTTLDALVRA